MYRTDRHTGTVNQIWIMNHQLDTFAPGKTPESFQKALYLERSTGGLDVQIWGREEVNWQTRYKGEKKQKSHVICPDVIKV